MLLDLVLTRFLLNPENREEKYLARGREPIAWRVVFGEITSRVTGRDSFCTLLTCVIKGPNKGRHSHSGHKSTHCNMLIERSQREERYFTRSHSRLYDTHAS